MKLVLKMIVISILTAGLNISADPPHAAGGITANVLIPNRDTPPPPLDLGLVGRLNWDESSNKLTLETAKGYVYTVGLPKDDAKLLEKVQNLAGKQVDISGTLYRGKEANLFVVKEVSFNASKDTGRYLVEIKDSAALGDFKRIMGQVQEEFPRAAIAMRDGASPGYVWIGSDLNKQHFASLLAEKAPFAKLR